MRLLQSSILKLRRRPATFRTLLVMVGLLSFLYLSIGLSAGRLPDPGARASLEPMLMFPSALVTLASIILIFGGLAGAGYAGAVAASEWSWNTLRAALARGESRVRYVVILFVAIALLVVAAWLLLCLVGVGLVLLGGALSGLSAGSPLDPANAGQFPAVLAAGAWALLMEVSLGFCMAFVSRSAVAGIATVAGLYFFEQFAALVVPIEVLRFAPITAAGSLVSAAGQMSLDAGLAWPLLATTVYLVLGVAVAAAVARRSQVP